VSDEAEFETIVVDNASADGSAELVRGDFPEVILIDAGKNLGFAAANNLGLARACGKFLMFLNPDTFVSRGTIVQLLDVLTRREQEETGAEKVAIAGATLVYPFGEPQVSVLKFPSLWREFWNFLPEVKSVLLKFARVVNSFVPFPEKQITAPYRVECVSGAAFMARADAMREVGGFDEGFFLYHEERDLCYRLAAAGWEIWTVPLATAIHFDAQASGYRPDRFPRSPILDYRILGMDRLYRKHRPGWQHKVWKIWAGMMLAARGEKVLRRRLRPENKGAKADK
jgi:hypothetical protein